MFSHRLLNVRFYYEVENIIGIYCVFIAFGIRYICCEIYNKYFSYFYSTRTWCQQIYLLGFAQYTFNRPRSCRSSPLVRYSSAVNFNRTWGSRAQLVLSLSNTRLLLHLNIRRLQRVSPYPSRRHCRLWGLRFFRTFYLLIAKARKTLL